MKKRKMTELLSNYAGGARNLLHRRRSIHKVGMAPGSLVYVGDKKVEASGFALTTYNAQDLKRTEPGSLEEIAKSLNPNRTNWLVVTGLHDVDMMEKLGEMFGIHSLIMEDILHTHQRPKLDLFENMAFIAARKSATENSAGQQISIVIRRDVVIAFLEEPDDLFDTIVQRLQNDASRLRRLGTDYLGYALLDVIVDHHLLAMEELSEHLEVVEEAAIRDPSESLIPEILKLKKQMMTLQKTVRPMRDVATRLVRDPGPLFSDEIKPFLQDLWDHAVQVTDTLENAQQLASAVLDVFYSSVSYRMNEIMKVLTIIATIFIPLSFIVGLYGMNFDVMPELKWRYGYLAVWGVIVTMVVGMLTYFKRKNWF